MTSFDWNIDDPNIIATASIDTTCTIWDVQRESIKTQIIAHDKEVYDISFATGTSVFASAGADGSIRQFDLRDLKHSIILCENPRKLPFVRICWNRRNANRFATLAMNDNKIMVFDTRYVGAPVVELTGHSNYVNSIAWAGNSEYSLI